jgi:hypothetical protein
VVVLAKLEESPKYRCPVHDLDSEAFQRLGFPDAKRLRASDFTLQEEYGVATYKGFVWVGQFSAAFLEIWKRNPATGLAARKGNRIVRCR